MGGVRGSQLAIPMPQTLCQNARMPTAEATAIARIRQTLLELEQQLASAAPPLPGSVPWLALDAEARLFELIELVCSALGLAGDAVGQRLQDVLEVMGDPLRGGLIRVRVDHAALPLFSIVHGQGACLVIGSGDPGGAIDRKLVHDLANVLAVVRGRAEMAAMDELPERVRASMDEIVVAVDRARALLGD
jgi:signal transduction histidine kinase